MCPANAKNTAVLLCVHWLEPTNVSFNRSQFLEEAVRLAKKGACSLLASTMWAGPDCFRQRDPAKDRTATIRQGTRLKDALDFLLETPGVDKTRYA